MAKQRRWDFWLGVMCLLMSSMGVSNILIFGTWSEYIGRVPTVIYGVTAVLAFGAYYSPRVRNLRERFLATMSV